ncbi:protein AMBP-like [Stegastes partitus]|uniref:Protein AMBP-like n=1 Tax=Stegastes partitus TaxID=144197 RepID=A0A9Y4N6X1_9TELE|nr:PREDICTED: protein AMBP-like [Stegastes partitus]
MQIAASVASLLVLGSAWTLQVAAVQPESQANFDLDQFMGRWYELAVVSDCPHYMQHKRENPVVVALELQHVASESNFTATAATFRNDSCKETSTVYSLTDTPGRFFHHFARFAADVDSFVVHTDYEEYAVMLQLSTEKPSETKTTKIKLYSRSTDISPAALKLFQSLVRQHGMSNDAVIKNHSKGECVPGGQATEAKNVTSAGV